MLGSLIRDARKAAGLRQCDLADLACVSLQHLRFIEQHRRRPSPSVVAMLERILGIELRAYM